MELNPALSQCRRCGTCCRKGGPALHDRDIQLVLEGRLPLEMLFTIRPQEPVMDNVAGRLVLARGDIIKIKSKKSSPTCIFLEHDSNCCAIYQTRPLECRTLECWQPEAITTIYRHQRLSREALLLPCRKWLWELVCEHEEHCNYLHVTRLARSWLVDNNPETAACLLEIMRYDAGMRQVCSNQGNIPAEILDFLFGLPLTTTIGRFGLALARNDKGKYYLIKTSTIKKGTPE